MVVVDEQGNECKSCNDEVGKTNKTISMRSSCINRHVRCVVRKQVDVRNIVNV